MDFRGDGRPLKQFFSLFRCRIGVIRKPDCLFGQLKLALFASTVVYQEPELNESCCGLNKATAFESKPPSFAQHRYADLVMECLGI